MREHRNDSNIDLVSSFLQVEGNLRITGTIFNYNKKGGVEFSGYKEVDGGFESVNIVMDKNQVELINRCIGVQEIYECYREMQYFNPELLEVQP